MNVCVEGGWEVGFVRTRKIYTGHDFSVTQPFRMCAVGGGCVRTVITSPTRRDETLPTIAIRMREPQCWGVHPHLSNDLNGYRPDRSMIDDRKGDGW
jgi:hypothetical protein